jgi:hypothetical protein
MKVGIGSPAAVPGIDAPVIGPWAAQSEHRGCASLGVTDRLVDGLTTVSDSFKTTQKSFGTNDT